MKKGAFAQQQRSQQPEQGTTEVSTVGLAVQQQQDSRSTVQTEKGTFAQQQRTAEADDDDEWIWPDSDDEDEERCIATLKALHRMDFSVMDAHRDEEQHRKQHDSCSTCIHTAQAQAQAQVQVQAQAQAQAQEIYSKQYWLARLAAAQELQAHRHKHKGTDTGTAA